MLFKRFKTRQKAEPVPRASTAATRAVAPTEVMFRRATLSKPPGEEDLKAGEIIECSISSEVPYQREFGLEILSHNPAHLNLERVQAGACPFLADHDETKMIGKVKDVVISGSRANAKIRIGTSALAQEILSDIKAGIRTEISVGYIINQMELINDDKEKGSTFLVTQWTLLHVASVATPADHTVGIGRSINNNPKEGKMDNELAAMRKAEEERIQDIKALGRMHNLDNEAQDAIRKGLSVEHFRSFLLDTLGMRSKGPVAIPDAAIGRYDSYDPYSNGLGMSRRELEHYNLFGVIEALTTGDFTRYGFEVEAHRAIEKVMGPARKGNSLYVPFEVLSRSITTGGSGSALVSTELRGDQFIDVLRNSSQVIEAGATVLNGLTSDVDIPRQTAASTGYWVPESGEPTESAPTYDTVSLSFKTVGATIDITRKQRIQSVVDMENLLKKDLAETLSSALDLGALVGTGQDNQPLGITKMTGVALVELAATPTWANIVKLETELGTDNTLHGRLGYMFPAAVGGSMKTTEKATNTGLFIWDGGLLNGYKAFMTNQVPAGNIIFGNWADLLVGIFGPGLEIQVDPYSLGKSGGIRINAFLSCDVAARRANSFCVGTPA